MYSYGLMLFELMTNGHKPFEELSNGYEIDKFVAQVCYGGVSKSCSKL